MPSSSAGSDHTQNRELCRPSLTSQALSELALESYRLVRLSLSWVTRPPSSRELFFFFFCATREALVRFSLSLKIHFRNAPASTSLYSNSHTMEPQLHSHLVRISFSISSNHTPTITSLRLLTSDATTGQVQHRVTFSPGSLSVTGNEPCAALVPTSFLP